MPVTNAHLDETLPWTERGKTGMQIKPNPDRPCGTLANRAGIAKNVAGLTDEERALRGDPAPLLTCAPTPTHVTDNGPGDAAARTSLTFRAVERAIGVAVGGGRLARRAAGRGR